MRTFEEWLAQEHPEHYDEDVKSFLRKAVMAGALGAASLGMTGCNDKATAPNRPTLNNQTMTVARPQPNTWVYSFQGQDVRTAVKDAKQWTQEELRNKGDQDWANGISTDCKQQGGKVVVTVYKTPAANRPMGGSSLKVSPGASRYFNQKVTSPEAAQFLK